MIGCRALETWLQEWDSARQAMIGCPETRRLDRLRGTRGEDSYESGGQGDRAWGGFDADLEGQSAAWLTLPGVSVAGLKALYQGCGRCP